MKIKNNKVSPVVFFYKSLKGRKSVRLKAGEVMKVNDFVEVISKNFVDNKWVEIIDDNIKNVVNEKKEKALEIKEKNKLKKAKEDVEKYING